MYQYIQSIVLYAQGAQHSKNPLFSYQKNLNSHQIEPASNLVSHECHYSETSPV